MKCFVMALPVVLSRERCATNCAWETDGLWRRSGRSAWRGGKWWWVWIGELTRNRRGWRRDVL